MKNNIKRKLYPGWMCLPAVGIYTVFYIVPIVIAFLFSFTDWNMDRLNSPVFSGFRNFINLFGDEVFLRSLGNTALFAIMTTIFKTIVGLGLALLVVQKFKGNGFFSYFILFAVRIKLYDCRSFIYRNLKTGWSFK